MLVGREPEQRRIAELLAAARLGQSGVLVLCGEAGIGKTALLDDTAAQTGDMTVLRASGREGESTLGFSGLHQLLRPALHLIDDIPGPQSEALAVALMLRNGPSPERFAVAAATLSLLSRYAEQAPLLILVDDAHLLDPPSAETLYFVARRLLADPIALVVCMRPERDVAFADPSLSAWEVRGLDQAAAAELVAESSATRMTAELYEVTAGNPLALVELSRDPEQLDRAGPELPLPVTQTVARVFGRRIAALPGAARTALLIAAVADGELTVTARAAQTMGTDVGLLAPGEEAGLLEIRAGRAEFRHPLVRSAIYAEADANTRRRVHRAVASALPSAMSERRAWHLSEACVGPDDAVASDLSVVAQSAKARGAYRVATAAFTRSAELTIDYPVQGARLTAAGESAWLAGRAAQATALLQRAEEVVCDPVELARIDGIRGNIALRAGSLRDAHDQLVSAASRVQDVDPDIAVLCLADAVTACFYLCDTAAGLAAAGRLERLVHHCAPGTRLRAQMAIGIARVLAGADGVRWIREAVAALSAQPSVLDDPRRPDWAIIGTLFLRESTTGRDLAEGVVRERRAHTALGALPNLLFHTARDDATTSRWHAAITEYDESISLARETGQSTDLAVSLAGLGWLQARMGAAEASRDNLAEAKQLGRSHDITLAQLWSEFALGDLALVLGDADGAVAHFRDLEVLLGGTGLGDVDLAPGPELAEALQRRGEVAQAKSVADKYFHRAAAKGQPWALARAHRALAVCCADAKERWAHFETAVGLHSDSPDTFEEARTRLAFGSALRRDKKRVAARPELQRALDAFDRLGARPWAEQAAAELDATGSRARRSGESPFSVLTSQEARIAQALGAGATTKEAAAALFLSPKTVEYHLRHIYQKLGLRSREELRAAVATEFDSSAVSSRSDSHTLTARARPQQLS